MTSHRGVPSKPKIENKKKNNTNKILVSISNEALTIIDVVQEQWMGTDGGC